MMLVLQGKERRHQRRHLEGEELASAPFNIEDREEAQVLDRFAVRIAEGRVRQVQRGQNETDHLVWQL